MMTRINLNETENNTMVAKEPSLAEKINMTSESVNNIFANVSSICGFLFNDDPALLPEVVPECLSEEIDLLKKRLDMLGDVIYSIKSRLMM